MTCHDFERLWNERLDTPLSREHDPVLEAHAASCPDCAAVAVRYQTLQQAIRTWGPPPSPSADFVERVLSAPVGRWKAPPRVSRLPTVARWAAAAGLLAASALALRLGLSVPETGPSLAPSPPKPVAATNPLDVALADATSATLDLAKATSAPAARLGKHVLANAMTPETSWPVPLDVIEPSEMLQSVGDRVEAGVRPLSGSARHAFRFLIAPARSANRPGA